MKMGPMIAMATIARNRMEPKTASLWRLKRRHAICHWLRETRLTSKSSEPGPPSGAPSVISAVRIVWSRAIDKGPPTSVVDDARVDDGVGHVGHEVGEHDDHGRHQQDPHQNRIVERLYGLDELPSHSRPREDRFGHDRSREEERDLESDIRDNG